jgi:hypothetical protein
MFAEVKDNSGNVTVASIIAAVNSDQSSVKISANKINLDGSVIVSSINNGSTIIDGGKIDASTLTVTNISATSGTVGGWSISNDRLYSTDSVVIGGSALDRYSRISPSEISIGLTAGHGNGTTYIMKLDGTDGSGQFAFGNFEWDWQGDITANNITLNSGTVGGWTISSDKLSFYGENEDGDMITIEFNTSHASGSYGPKLYIDKNTL